MLMKWFDHAVLEGEIRVEPPTGGMSNGLWRVTVNGIKYPAKVKSCGTSVEVHEFQNKDGLALKRADVGQQVLYVFRTEEDLKTDLNTAGLTAPTCCRSHGPPPPPAAAAVEKTMKEITQEVDRKIIHTTVPYQTWMEEGKIYSVEDENFWTTDAGRFFLENSESFVSQAQSPTSADNNHRKPPHTDGGDDDDDDDDDDNWMVSSSEDEEDEDSR